MRLASRTRRILKRQTLLLKPALPFAERVANYGAENVFVVSYVPVQSRRLRELFADFLFAQDGLLHASGIPKADLVWTNSRSDKRRRFAQNDLTHFVDD